MTNSDSREPEVVEVYGPGDRRERNWCFVIDPHDQEKRVKQWVSENLAGEDWTVVSREDDFFMYVACNSDDACIIKLKFPN